MKVFDLQCGRGHIFEGWFASEADFVGQRERALVECPMCGDPSVVKKLSAPRLLLSDNRVEGAASRNLPTEQDLGNQAGLENAWAALVRKVVAQTDDVGDQFAEEARKIHYGEQAPRGLRGTATLAEARSLVDEGIEVVPFPLPSAMKGRLQ